VGVAHVRNEKRCKIEKNIYFINLHNKMYLIFPNANEGILCVDDMCEPEPISTYNIYDDFGDEECKDVWSQEFNDDGSFYLLIHFNSTTLYLHHDSRNEFYPYTREGAIKFIEIDNTFREFHTRKILHLQLIPNDGVDDNPNYFYYLRLSNQEDIEDFENTSIISLVSSLITLK
jgi:hypothetical protein